jgi:Family of unknown function (DUF6493)
VLAVAVALACRDADARQLAVDALIEAVADGRAHPAPLASALVRFQRAGWLKLNRLAAALAEIARPTPLHRLFVIGVLESFLAGLEKLPRNAHQVLEVVAECAAIVDHSLPADLAERWAKEKVGGKTGRLLAALRARAGQGPGAAERRAVAGAWASLFARVDRAMEPRAVGR